MSKFSHWSYTRSSKSSGDGRPLNNEVYYNWSLLSNQTMFQQFLNNKNDGEYSNKMKDVHNLDEVNDAHFNKISDLQNENATNHVQYENEIKDVHYENLIKDVQYENAIKDMQNQNEISDAQYHYEINGEQHQNEILDTQYHNEINGVQYQNEINDLQNGTNDAKYHNEINGLQYNNKTNGVQYQNEINDLQNLSEKNHKQFHDVIKDVIYQEINNARANDINNPNKKYVPTHLNMTINEVKTSPNTTRKRIDYENLLGCRKLPDILIIGFEKCGTVTLKSYLGIHPQIFFPNLLVNYKLFDKSKRISVKTYTRNRQCTPHGKLRLEKLATTGVASRAYEVVPDIKLIAIVKEPVERSMSHYVHRIAEGIEKKPYNFDSMIGSIMDYDRPFTLKSSVLFRQSRYIDRLEPWIAHYGIDKIHVIDGDAFVKNPAAELQKVETFLGLKPFISENHFAYNPVKKFYCLKQPGNEGCMTSNKGRPHPEMSNATRTRLQEYYKPYNQKLFATIGRTFPWNY